MDETRERGVKKRWNFLGVMDGFLRSLPRLGSSVGGDESRLAPKGAELLVAEEDVFSDMITGCADMRFGVDPALRDGDRPSSFYTLHTGTMARQLGLLLSLRLALGRGPPSFEEGNLAVLQDAVRGAMTRWRAWV